ncbi:MAG: stage III sporulation protein AB, partial [Clostridiales bacterium]|nr:stage III sporulation protein AB [Clostridiales bacterium]
MLKVLGVLLLLGGGGALGLSAAAQLRARTSCLRALAASLTRMEQELTFRLTNTPALFALLARDAAPPCDSFFQRCLAGLADLGEKSVGEIWRGALEESGLPLRQGERQVLQSLGDVLGRYDGEGQNTALRLARTYITRAMEEAEEEQRRLGRMYSVLGLTSGLFLAL